MAEGIADEANNHVDCEFVEYVVKMLSDQPESVKVSRTIDERGVLVTLEVAKEDMGRIIGKKGQTAKALRVLLRIIGAKNQSRINLKIVEPGGKEVMIDGPNGDDSDGSEA